MKFYLLIFFASILCFSCSEEVSPQEPVNASGRVVKNEVSSFMYGTHLLVQGEDSVAFALRSSTINLDNYLHQQVRVTGKTIAGYPVDGGPIYVEVTRVEEKKD
ncbi:hypothetical protein [Pontibacter ruber]|uniref:Uncharacterized protein n=1 Tax=Pontibacter ruber TaxID=1343895 RepID=A0ABW5CW94_9BACT|nr:hypothetical protein [Pontibacter ruber]